MVNAYRAEPGDQVHHERVTRMFNRIAGRYDISNRVMTACLDLLWRRALVREFDPSAQPRILDVCSGTGDIALALSRQGHVVSALDAADAMLRLARQRAGATRIGWYLGDACALPFNDGRFEGVSISFGIRNIADRALALREFRRVVRPGGRLAVLEALLPTNRLWRAAMSVYERITFPLVGRALVRDGGAYEYLAGSIAGFGSASEFELQMTEAGWSDIRTRRLIGGGVALFSATNE